MYRKYCLLLGAKDFTLIRCGANINIQFDNNKIYLFFVGFVGTGRDLSLRYFLNHD